MNNRNFQHIADDIFIRKLLNENILSYKKADMLDGLAQGVVDYVKSQYDPNRPIASITNFMAPVALSAIIPWSGVIYELAVALGFNGIEFWQSVVDAIKPELEKAEKEGREHFDLSKVNTTVDDAVKKSTKPTDEDVFDKLSNFFKKWWNDPSLKSIVSSDTEKSAISIKEALFLKKVAEHYHYRYDGLPPSIKTAGPWDFLGKGLLGGGKKIVQTTAAKTLTGKVLSFLTSIFRWLITKMLKALGFGVVGGVVAFEAGTLDKKKEQKEGDLADIKKVKLFINSNLRPQYTEHHNNDAQSTWFEPIDIKNIENILMDWAHDAYQQLNKKDAFHQSPKFNAVVKKFEEINKNSDFSVVAIPKPFHTILEIIDSFAADVAARTEP